MELAELLIPVFKERKTDQLGNKPRFISIHDVEVEYHQTSDVHELRTTVHYLSDIGDWEENLLIRYFDSGYYYTLERTQYERMLARTNVFENIEPVELLVSDEPEQVLIYRSPQGIHLKELGLSANLYYFQLGILMGILHGGETSILQLDNYKSMAEYMINKIPFDEETRKVIKHLIQSEFELLTNSYAGFEPVTQIDLFHVRFTPQDDLITKNKIISGEAFYIEIVPLLLSNVQMDRMEDVANVFAVDAYQEFIQTGDVAQTKNNILSLMEGYEGYFGQYSHAPMDRIYPEGLSLDLHMLLAIWLVVLSQYQYDTTFDMGGIVRYSLFVLDQNPFQVYGT